MLPKEITQLILDIAPYTAQRAIREELEDRISRYGATQREEVLDKVAERGKARDYLLAAEVIEGLTDAPLEWAWVLDPLASLLRKKGK